MAGKTSGMQASVVVVDWSSRTVVRDGEAGHAERVEMAANISRLRQELNKAVQENRPTDAARALVALRDAGIPEADLEAESQAVVFLARRKLSTAA